MHKFWWSIRLRWLGFVLLFSLALGAFLTLIITVVTLLSVGINFSAEGMKALYTLVSFWFKLSWVLSFLVALILSFKSLFNKNISGKRLLLLECESKEPYDPIILIDIIPIWRKFLFWMVWILLVAVLLLLGAFNMDRSSLGGLPLFVLIVLFGMLILKPLLLSIKNIRIVDVNE